MKIISDFRDYYFPFADGTGPVLILDSNGGPNKREQFVLLEKAGFAVPPHGLVKEIGGEYWDEGRINWLVVYENESSHCGEGKKLINEAHYKFDGCVAVDRLKQIEYFSNLYCSAFIFNSRGLSWRRLQIGHTAWWIEYKSNDDWRSNCGDTDCYVIGDNWQEMTNPFPEYPIWAVDFAIGKKDMYAIDFNIAPGIRGTGIEKYLTGKKVCEILETALANQKNPDSMKSSYVLKS